VAGSLDDLLQRCCRSDEDAVRVLVERFGPAAQDLAVAILKDRHLAEDAVQAGFVAALGRLGQLRQAEAFPAWLRQIVRTQAHRILRKRQERCEEVAEPVAEGASPEECLQQRERQELVRRALMQVSQRGREAAELFYFEEYSVMQIARQLGVPEGTVKRRLHDVREQLRNLLLGPITDPEDAAKPAEPPDLRLL
jgi:RNA polymerase sigma factor (sigma-70 family)